MKENAAAVPTVGWSLLNERAGQTPAHLPAATECSFAKAAEQVRKSLASIHREMTVLPDQAEQWRTAATEFSVNAALSTIPDIRSFMFKIAEAYQGMARVADQNYATYVKEERIVCYRDRVFLCM